MAITARQMCTDALVEANLIQAGEAMSAEDAADALRRFNQMGHEFDGLGGIRWNWTTLALEDEIPHPESHERGIRLLLAVELCTMFDKPVPSDLATMAGRAKRNLMAHYGQNLESTMDPMLTSFRANRRNDDTPLTG